MLHSLWTTICLTICFRKYNLKRRERNWDEWRSMATRFWFCSSIFRISWLWIRFRTLKFCMCEGHDDRRDPCLSFNSRDLVFFVLRLRNLEPSFKFQRVPCSKKEDEETCQSVTKGVGKNDFSSWESHCHYFVTLHVQHSHHRGNDCFLISCDK